MITLAEVLYHATYPDVEDSIEDSGLLPGVNGHVSLCTVPSHAAGFINMYGCSRMLGTRYTDDLNATKITSDLLVTEDFQSILVVGVKVSMLDDRDISMNMYDKSQSISGILPQFLQSYEHYGPIPVDAIIEKHRFLKDDKRIDHLFFYSHKRKTIY
jgi:hypothetical protein